MSCEKYQEALIDLAASDAEPVGVVCLHLEGCASCRSYLERERVLFATIDFGVHQNANAPLPASLLQRFGARLEQQTPPRQSQSARWMYAGAALATAAVLILFLLPNLRSRNTKQQSLRTVKISPQHGVEAQKANSTVPLKAATRPVRQPGKRSRTAAPNPEPEVLVPPEERIAFERFLADLNGRQDLAAAIVKPIHAQREQRVISLDTPDIETAALTVEPIQDGGDR
jgi:hypothetical protein